ncbi:beta strand repeat-containing protein [Cerasicoccus frondis]|uniref:beta strand repeat-containing protein n=1 Tax=Cerasicoccus frondis TaxID=490090 RepID=UPI0028528486|nr:hypothetical protein [Cerasicoccus frondis]
MSFISTPVNADDAPALTASPGFLTETFYEFNRASAILPLEESNPTLPGYVTLEAAGTGEPVELQIDLFPSINYSPATAFYGSLFQFSTELGTPTAIDERHPLIVNSHGSLSVSNIQAPDDATVIGNAAILALGRPNGNADGIGSDVTVNVSNDITVSGVGTGNPGAGTNPITLSPSALRTAQLSGVTAVSWGLQDSGNESNSLTGTTVTVNTDESANITVTQSSDAVITAGISASSASGPATDGFGTDVNGFHKVAISHSGDITVNAQTGVGIFANTTGAQKKNDDSETTAVGGEVKVDLKETASITTSGVGIFALSEVSPVSDKGKDTIEGGEVKVDLGEHTSITAGNESDGSTLSIGVLAVSAASNQLLNPFSSVDVPNDSKGDGKGGGVTVKNHGMITTYGDTSAGIAALSIGGASVVASTNEGTAQNDSYLGANDAYKGGGKQVTVENLESGVISTTGLAAHGMVGLSSASGGLLNNLEEANRDQNPPVGLTIGNGPSSSSDIGHDGGDVSMTNAGTIVTGAGSGDSMASVGMLAQSIGGGGGSAGNKASLFVGDKGGAGGHGGTVDITTKSTSSLTTNDINSVGILAQSIGGGGGNGGNAEGFFVAVGGGGGAGGEGGDITLNFDGSLSTNQMHSGGIISQSVGGGGGHGGGATAVSPIFSPEDFSIGGSGGSGGSGGMVTATLAADSTVSTLGNNSAGLTIQSIGGGGGTGGAATTFTADVFFSLAAAVGGSGEGGGHGSRVVLNNSGMITTGSSASASPSGQPVNEGADSIGAIVQSIGGGGGHGGSASAFAGVFAATDEIPIGVAVSLGLGGEGAGGGNGGDAFFNHDGSITTWGDGSHGALVQSIGGGGGNGGDSTAYSAALTAKADGVTLQASHGGVAGNGGVGGGVAVNIEDHQEAFTTHGQNAAGLVAQSIGGGGGNGGFGTARSSNINLTGGQTVNIGFALGGSGGDGGHSGAVAIASAGDISTNGSGSQGILAQSIGGGGGNAGGGSVGGGNNNYEVNVAVGASGGDGGDGGRVGVANEGSIQTTRGDATGILAQSIGGGGGTGGSADVRAPTGYLGNVLDTFSPALSYSSAVSVGGTGGSGGMGGDVVVENLEGASISTEGVRAYGILAHSISGGGGTGGSANASSNAALLPVVLHRDYASFSINVSVGGLGGSSQTGGVVTVDNHSLVETSGYASHGIVAQSIGGGGGVGADGSLDTTTTLNLGFIVDRGSGASGHGGEVHVTQDATVTTTGHNSYGVLAQSIGGGGGIASQGTDIASTGGNIGIFPNPEMGMNFGFNIDSKEGEYINGGSVTLKLNEPDDLIANPSTTTTEGDWSMGVVAQSVGAGGGKGDTISGTNTTAIPNLDLQLGALSGNGSGGSLEIDTVGTASIMTGTDTSGFGAYGLLAQSIGGGGGIATDGSSAATGSLSLGGQAGSVDGDGGTITLISDALSVQTQGAAAHGVVLQSIGGGGGLAGTGASADYSGSLTDTKAPSLSLGGQDSIGIGQAITMDDAVVTVSTSGDHAFGFVAQSIGGGGGIATTKQMGGDVAVGMTITDGSTDSAGRDGNEVELTFAVGSSINTTGIGAHGVVAQSIGGGGGIANPDSSSGLDLSPDQRSETALGYGGDVTLNLHGSITSHGDGANGVVAQVIGGGGGLFNQFAGSTGGASSSADGSSNGLLTINVGHEARIRSHGSTTNTILAQNAVGNGQSGNTITITVDGMVSSENGAAIMVNGGRGSETDGVTNSVTINLGGEVTSSYNEKAIQFEGIGGSEVYTINNHGLLSGSVSVDSTGSGSLFFNNETGVFHSGETVNMVMEDSGRFVVGGADIVKTEMHQNYIQYSNAEAILQFDVESQESFDHLVFGTAYGMFNGLLEIILTDNGTQLQVGDEMTLITASTGETAHSFSTEFYEDASFINVPESMILDLNVDSGALVLSVVAVPEPNSTLPVGLAVLIYLLRRSRYSRGA